MNEEDLTPADFIPNHKEYQNDEVIELYNDWTNYEKAMLDEDYVGHIETTNLVAKYHSVTERESVRILDIGAGSGLIGIELKRRGFLHIDALDPCRTLLQQAKDRNVYEHYFLECLSPCSLPSEAYDCVTAAACFGGTHIPPVLLVEVLRLLRTESLNSDSELQSIMKTRAQHADANVRLFKGLIVGGLAFITVRDLPENLGLIDVSEDLQRQGKMDILQVYNFPRFRKGIRGICYIYQKI